MEIDRLTVFPALLPLEELHLSPEYPIGDQRSRKRISEDPNQVMGVRDYHPEDNFRRLHWPATARNRSSSRSKSTSLHQLRF